ncbi:MAG: hypothetical protein ABI080_09475 [Candidatus Binatia bacterium]
MNKVMHLRWLRLKRQTRLSGPRAAQRRKAAWATLPIFTEIEPSFELGTTAARDGAR